MPDNPIRPPISGKPQPPRVPAGWVSVSGWRTHTQDEIIFRANKRLSTAERISLLKVIDGEFGPLKAPPSKTWALKLPGGQHGFLVGEGKFMSTILGMEGSRVMGLEFEVDITPYYFPDLQYPKPPTKTSSLPGFDYDMAVHGMDLFLQ